MTDYIIPKTITGKEIKELRMSLNMLQNEFARFLNVSLRTIERWESGNDNISGAICTLYEILIRNPELESGLRIEPNKLKLRLKYMHKDILCTVIDVDEVEKKIEIRNYVKNTMFRAFGINTEPEYEDYEEFLESRCFPKTRDKMKLELKKLGLSFYDPIMIIEKTEGRMAEDDFWIKIER